MITHHSTHIKWLSYGDYSAGVTALSGLLLLSAGSQLQYGDYRIATIHMLCSSSYQRLQYISYSTIYYNGSTYGINNVNPFSIKTTADFATLAIYMNGAYIGVKEWLAYAYLPSGRDTGGLLLLRADTWITTEYFSIATNAIYMNANSITTRSWMSYGYLAYGTSDGGLSTLNSNLGLDYLRWILATLLSI